MEKKNQMPVPKAADQKKNEAAYKERHEGATAQHGDVSQVGGGKIDDHEHTKEEAGSDVDLQQMTGAPNDQTGAAVPKTTIVTDEAGEKKVVKSKPIDVVATRDGYYKQERKKPGDKFTIEGEHQMGDWMEVL